MGGCDGRATTCTNLQIYFVPHLVRDNVVILEEGNRPQPCFPVCDMFVNWAALNHRHPAMALCARGEERKRRRLEEEEPREGTVMTVWDYDRPLGIVSSFKYL